MYYATYVKGDPIVYLPKEGQIVKKGEVLTKWDTSDIDLNIKSMEYSLKEAEECLKDAKTDIERQKKLHKLNIVSTTSYENVNHLYTCGKLTVEKMKLDIAYYKKYRDAYTVKAPYDLKIIKRIVSIGSGCKMGEEILEVQKL